MTLGATIRSVGLSLLLVGVLPMAGMPAIAAPRTEGHAHDQQHQHPVSATPQEHSAHQHQHAGEGSHAGHMALMEAFKKLVPEDYRIMERTPVINSQESLLRGRHLYMLNCASCHGALGRGNGPGAAGMKTPPADFLDFEHSAHYGPGEKFWLIAKGSQSMGMPAHPQVSPKDIWHLVNYILALQDKVKSEGYDQPPHKH